MAGKANLAKIHIAKKELGLSDDIYRDVLFTQFKKSSSRDLTDFQCVKLLLHFETLGWKSGAKKIADDPQSKKIVAMWGELYRAGKVNVNGAAALNSYVTRMTGKDALKWCNRRQKSFVIECLKKWLEREVGCE